MNRKKIWTIINKVNLDKGKSSLQTRRKDRCMLILHIIYINYDPNTKTTHCTLIITQ